MRAAESGISPGARLAARIPVLSEAGYARSGGWPRRSLHVILSHEIARRRREFFRRGSLFPGLESGVGNLWRCCGMLYAARQTTFAPCPVWQPQDSERPVRGLFRAG